MYTLVSFCVLFVNKKMDINRFHSVAFHSLYNSHSSNMNKFLASVYYDPKNPAGFSTVTKLYNASKSAGKRYSRADIEKSGS